MMEGNVPQNTMAILHSGSLLMSSNIFYSINENVSGFIVCWHLAMARRIFFFLKGGILLHYRSHSALEKCDPLTAEVMHCVLFYKILKVRMSHQSTDSVANDPPGEPAWPRWTERGEGESPRARMKCCTLSNSEKTQRPCQLSSLLPGAVCSNDSFSNGNPSKTKRRSAHDADRLEEMQRKQISAHQKATLFHCAETLELFPFDLGRVFKGAIGPWTVVMCRQLHGLVVSNLRILGKYSKVIPNLGHIKLPA